MQSFVIWQLKACDWPAVKAHNYGAIICFYDYLGIFTKLVVFFREEISVPAWNTVLLV